MWSWIEIAALYLLGMGLLCWLGGIAAAGDAISRWGRESVGNHRDVVSPSS